MENLPVEVFDIIASYIQLRAYQQLRLSSRQLYSLTLSTFAKRYFVELTTTLGSPSLDRLVSISKHAYFSAITKRLKIKLLTHDDYKTLTDVARVGIYPPPKRFSMVPKIRIADIEGESSLYRDLVSGDQPKCCITKRLARAFRGFQNLKDIRFRTLNSDSGAWLFRDMSDDQKFRAKCFQAVLESVVESEMELEELCMARNMGTSHLHRGVNLAATDLQLSLPVLSALQQSFVNLQSLTLSLVAKSNGGSRVPGWENGTSQLLSCAPNLRHLAMSLDCSARISHYSAAIVKSLASSCRFPALESLHLMNCTAHEHDLEQFITAHAESLQVLTLDVPCMLSGCLITFWVSLKNVKGLRRFRFGPTKVKGTDVPLPGIKERLRMTRLDTIESRKQMSDMLDELITLTSAEDGALAFDSTS
ncbi:Protein-lysine N-methyltransferase efm4 [Pleosporales sp. CAS-2024a]